ncbi:MAG: HK97 gp10 family phage protein [Eubacterium sp.]|nr:HK97 gp10 family phage protein [Eubacterium sp.]DAY52261.1 MAG TPA: putative tail component [Caudoviricetes sp.]
MANFEFELDGLEELESDLRFAMEEYPTEMRKGLRKIANEFKNSCKARTPDGTTSKDASKKLRRKFGVRTKIEGDTSIALVFNSARHFHLVENGHNLVRGGKTVGWVPGKHMMEQTRNEYQDVVPGEFEKLCDETLRRHDL